MTEVLNDKPVREPQEGSRVGAVQAIIFDLDGTLIDTIGLILKSMRYAVQDVLGEDPSDELLMRNVGAPLVDMMACFDESRVDELVDSYRTFNRKVHDDLIREYPGTGEVLDQLTRDGVTMGIVTSKSNGIARRGLDLFGLGHHFEVLVGYDDVPVHKPDPYPLHYAADLLGVPLEDCAYIGDSPHDMTAAIAGGATAVAALWGAFKEAEVLRPGPEFALPSIEHLLEWFYGDPEIYRVSRTL